MKLAVVVWTLCADTEAAWSLPWRRWEVCRSAAAGGQCFQQAAEEKAWPQKQRRHWWTGRLVSWISISLTAVHAHAHTHTRITALFPGLLGWAGTRKVKPIWILLKEETVSGSGISWAICKTDNHASTPPLSFLQAGCPSCRPTNSVKHWNQITAVVTRMLRPLCGQLVLAGTHS